MLERLRNFLINREWAMFVGIATTIITSGEELLEQFSILASEQNDWTPIGLLPLVAAIATRTRVSSNEAVKDIKEHLA